MDRRYILGISGTPRSGGNSEILLSQILEGAKQSGCVVEAVHLRSYAITGCVGCERCRAEGVCEKHQDGMQLLYPKLERAGGIVLVSPVYNYNITSQMKAFIDRLYPYYEFSNDRPRRYRSRWRNEGKKAIVAAVAEQEDLKDMGFAIEAMQMPLEALAFDVVCELRALGFLKKGEVRRDESILEKARQLGRILAESMV